MCVRLHFYNFKSHCSKHFYRNKLLYAILRCGYPFLTLLGIQKKHKRLPTHKYLQLPWCCFQKFIGRSQPKFCSLDNERKWWIHQEIPHQLTNSDSIQKSQRATYNHRLLKGRLCDINNLVNFSLIFPSGNWGPTK